MKTYFLHKNENSKELILFFGGFASHFSHFKHLSSKKNVLMCYDYEDFNLTLNLNSFEKITLIAFSMGVCIANKLLRNVNFYSKIKLKIAINGSNLGIDKKLGIHPRVFLKTIKKFSLENFKKTLFKEEINLAKDFVFKQEKELKKELENLWNFANKEQESFLVWDKIYASKNDAIFPTSALENSFKTLDFIDAPHFLFFHFNAWDLF